MVRRSRIDRPLQWGIIALPFSHDLDEEIEVRNQARVHLWYEQKFGAPYPRLRSALEGIDRFLAPACMVGIRAEADEHFETYAPRGYDDIEQMTIRPNLCPNFSPERYQEKARRWQQAWPKLTVLPARSDDSSTRSLQSKTEKGE